MVVMVVVTKCDKIKIVVVTDDMICNGAQLVKMSACISCHPSLQGGSTFL